jgi:hypothetical protein
MALTPEETRALEHKRQERRREAFQRSLQAALKGNGARYKELLEKTRPLSRRG